MQGFFAALRTLVQFRRWDEILSSDHLARPAKPRAQAWYHWARAVAEYERGNPAAAAQEVESFEQAMREYRTSAGKVHPSLNVAKEELRARAVLARRDWKRARSLFEKASESERSLRYNEPPSYPRPVAEALGHAALRRGDTKTAERAFRIALEQFPANWHAESGLRALTDYQTRAAR
jgi:Flp pilus assembly protein TadD